MVLFGGASKNGSGYLSDTWTWDGTTWAKSASTGPSARWRAPMTYDAGSGDVVLFGGIKKSGNGFLSDTWTWDGTTWSQVDDSGDPGCTTCSGGPGRFSNQCVDGLRRGDWPRGAVRGLQQQRQRSFGHLDVGRGHVDPGRRPGQVGCTTCSGSPPPRYGASMAYDSALGVVVLFGGTADGLSSLSDTWEWNGAWTPGRRHGAGGVHELRRQPPFALRCVLVLRRDDGAVVLFGGIDYNLNIVSDTWEWNGSWTQIDDLQQPGCTTSCPGGAVGLWESSMAYDPVTADVVLFGGFNAAASILSDTWTGP